jgi:hypothetical protein
MPLAHCWLLGQQVSRAAREHWAIRFFGGPVTGSEGGRESIHGGLGSTNRRQAAPTPMSKLIGASLDGSIPAADTPATRYPTPLAED